MLVKNVFKGPIALKNKLGNRILTIPRGDTYDFTSYASYDDFKESIDGMKFGGMLIELGSNSSIKKSESRVQPRTGVNSPVESSSPIFAERDEKEREKLYKEFQKLTKGSKLLGPDLCVEELRSIIHKERQSKK